MIAERERESNIVFNDYSVARAWFFENTHFSIYFIYFLNFEFQFSELNSYIKGMKEYMIDDVKSEIKEVPITFYRDSSRLVKLGDLIGSE